MNGTGVGRVQVDDALNAVGGLVRMYGELDVRNEGTAGELALPGAPCDSDSGEADELELASDDRDWSCGMLGGVWACSVGGHLARFGVREGAVAVG